MRRGGGQRGGSQRETGDSHRERGALEHRMLHEIFLSSLVSFRNTPIMLNGPQPAFQEGKKSSAPDFWFISLGEPRL
jgi:hypothetical protein